MDCATYRLPVFRELGSWRQAMLADPVIGPVMVWAMAHERHAAGQPLDRVRDYYDGPTFRIPFGAETFASDISVALSISTDGFEAWRQFHHWPIMANVRNAEHSERARIVAQLLLCVALGSRQQADLESFLLPVAKQLGIGSSCERSHCVPKVRIPKFFMRMSCHSQQICQAVTSFSMRRGKTAHTETAPETSLGCATASGSIVPRRTPLLVHDCLLSVVKEPLADQAPASLQAPKEFSICTRQHQVKLQLRMWRKRRGSRVSRYHLARPSGLALEPEDSFLWG